MRSLIVATLAASACSGSSSSPPAAVQTSCTTFATTIDAARQLREEASAQYVSANTAMMKWRQWSKKLVPAEQDGSGDYSGAASRLRGYRDAGFALCQSAALVHGMLREVPTADTELREVATKADPPRCELPSISWSDYDRFSSRWQAMKQQARDREDAILDVCRKKIPRWSPPVASLPSITLLSE
ncbi:MAG: hypothetical protein HOV81_07600 [Kofleriaceae bacterium]|nr:hypothetical protein [Kofleriaceae bacterium]